MCALPPLVPFHNLNLSIVPPPPARALCHAPPPRSLPARALPRGPTRLVGTPKTLGKAGSLSFFFLVVSVQKHGPTPGAMPVLLPSHAIITKNDRFMGGLDVTIMCSFGAVCFVGKKNVPIFSTPLFVGLTGTRDVQGVGLYDSAHILPVLTFLRICGC